MKRKIGVIVILFVFICYAFVLAISISPTKNLEEITVETIRKPTVLILVDSLMSEPLEEFIQKGNAPAFEFFIKNGHFEKEMISSYPTMSVTIDSTLLTGAYANLHKVPGLVWFHTNENRMISYSSGVAEIKNNGVKKVALDSILHLNETHLSKEVQTIHEELTAVNLSSASINGLLYRGSFPQKLTIPKLISLTGLLPKEIEVSGPTVLSLGAFSQYDSQNHKQKYIWKRLGVNNTFTINELKLLISQNKLPAFTLAYLPETDASVHDHGPTDLKGIKKAEVALQNLLNSFSSWEDALKEINWIILGDSGQSFINEDKKTSLIDLNELLNKYTFWEDSPTDGQLALAVNERMAYIYINDPTVNRSEIINALQKDARIAFIAWKDDQANYCVVPKNPEKLIFKPQGTYKDNYNQLWQIEGDTSVLDLNITNDNNIQYGNYPDGLARLYGALHSQEGEVIIVDAKESYEFVKEFSRDHAGGGGHGSLHKIDSVVPLIVTGTEQLPEYNRLVDIKAWIIQLMKENK